MLNARGLELDDWKQRHADQEVIIQQYQLIESENQRLKEKQDQINGDADKWRSSQLETESQLTEVKQVVEKTTNDNTLL